MGLLVLLILLVLLFGGVGVFTAAKWVLILALICLVAAALSGSRL